jgi:hypothetical protein
MIAKTFTPEIGAKPFAIMVGAERDDSPSNFGLCNSLGVIGGSSLPSDLLVAHSARNRARGCHGKSA